MAAPSAAARSAGKVEKPVDSMYPSPCRLAWRFRRRRRWFHLRSGPRKVNEEWTAIRPRSRRCGRRRAARPGALSRGDADRQRPRHQPARARRPRRRRRARRRGHPPHPQAPRDPRHPPRPASCPTTTTTAPRSARGSSRRWPRAARWRSSPTPARRSSPTPATASPPRRSPPATRSPRCPGASALLAALAVAGLPTDRFLFAGFLAAAPAARRRALAELAAGPGDARLLRIPPPPRRQPRRHGRGPRRGPPRRGLPRAHQALRGDPPGAARRARRALCRRARSRRARSWCWPGGPVAAPAAAEALDAALAAALDGQTRARRRRRGGGGARPAAARRSTPGRWSSPRR